MSRQGPPGEALEVSLTGSGSPILLLHGFTGTSAGWSTIVAALETGHRVLVPDLLGHGRSDAPHTPTSYALPRQAAVLRSLLVELSADPAAVLGYSMGARLALHLAAEYPGSVSALILVSPSAGFADTAARARRRADDERWARRLEQEGLAAFVAAWQAQPLFASLEALPSDVRAGLQAERLSHDPLALAASLRGAGQGVMEPLRDRLRAIRVPTLVIAGGLDPIGCDRAREVAERLPAARLEVVVDAGHAPHLERPARLIDLLSTFLGSPGAVTVSLEVSP